MKKYRKPEKKKGKQIETWKNNETKSKRKIK